MAPGGRTSSLYAFEKQTAVTPNLIAFRAIAALAVATLVNFGATPIESKLAAFVPAVETWIGEIAEDDPRDPREAASLGRIISHITLSKRVADIFASSTR